MLFVPFSQKHTADLPKLVYHSLGQFNHIFTVKHSSNEILLNHYYVDELGNLSTFLNIYGMLFEVVLKYDILNMNERVEYQQIIQRSKALKEIIVIVLEPTEENKYHVIIVEYAGNPFFSQRFTLEQIEENHIYFSCEYPELEKVLFPNENSTGLVVFEIALSSVRHEISFSIFHQNDSAYENRIFVKSLILSQ